MFQSLNRKVAKTNKILQIGVVTEDPGTGAKFQELLSRRDGVGVEVIASGSVTAKSQPKDIGIFVYELNTSKQASRQEFDRFMSERSPNIPLIVLCPAVDDELVRWFLRLRVSDWLKTPLSPGELIAACGRVLSHHLTPKQDGKCITFIGARGGVGATTLAIHAALILQGTSATRSPTCVVDLDFVSGSCADYLDLTPGWQLEELIPNPSRLDNHLMDIMMVTHPVGISVLAAQLKYGHSLSINEDVVTGALDLVSQRFENVVIDLPRRAERWSESVIHGSTKVFVVTDFSIPGLKAAVRLTSEIADKTGSEAPPRVIVNKFERSLFSSGISRHEVKEILRSSLAGYVRASSRLVREAIDRGIPTTSIKPKNAIMSELAGILRK